MLEFKVNTFLVGSPKCGTTALYTLLKKDNKVFFPYYKEPHFFAEDLGSYKAHETLEEFHSLYNSYKNEEIIGDASIFNLYSSVALNNIKKYNSEAKLILMLRNPVEAVPSFHSQLLFTQDENISSLEEAWEISGQRSKPKNALKGCKSLKVLNYKEMYAYGSQLKKVYSIFPKEQVHVIIYDDFKKDYSAEMEKLFAFLGLEYSFIENEIVNENTENRFNFFTRLMRRPPGFLVHLKRFFFGRGENALYRFLLDLNTKKKKRLPLNSKLKEKIKLNYQEEIVLLESILGRELHEWK